MLLVLNFPMSFISNLSGRKAPRSSITCYFGDSIAPTQIRLTRPSFWRIRSLTLKLRSRRAEGYCEVFQLTLSLLACPSPGWYQAMAQE